MYLWWSGLKNAQTEIQSFSTLIRCSGYDTSNDAIIHVGLGFSVFDYLSHNQSLLRKEIHYRYNP